MTINQEIRSSSEKMTKDAIALLNDILAPRSKVLRFRPDSIRDVLLIDTNANKVTKQIPVSNLMQMTYDQLMRL